MPECCQEEADQFSLEETIQAQIQDQSNQNAKLIQQPLQMPELIIPPQTQTHKTNRLQKHITSEHH